MSSSPVRGPAAGMENRRFTVIPMKEQIGWYCLWFRYHDARAFVTSVSGTAINTSSMYTRHNSKGGHTRDDIAETISPAISSPTCHQRYCYIWYFGGGVHTAISATVVLEDMHYCGAG